MSYLYIVPHAFDMQSNDINLKYTYNTDERNINYSDNNKRKREYKPVKFDTRNRTYAKSDIYHVQSTTHFK